MNGGILRVCELLSVADEGDVSATAAACCMYLLCPRPGQTGDIWESPVTTVKKR